MQFFTPSLYTKDDHVILILRCLCDQHQLVCLLLNSKILFSSTLAVTTNVILRVLNMLQGLHFAVSYHFILSFWPKKLAARWSLRFTAALFSNFLAFLTVCLRKQLCTDAVACTYHWTKIFFVRPFVFLRIFLYATCSTTFIMVAAFACTSRPARSFTISSRHSHALFTLALQPPFQSSMLLCGFR